MPPRFSTLPDWLAWQETLHPSAIDLGLERVRMVAARLDLLTPKFAVVTVGGTNGKGSTVAFLDSILRAAHYRVGAYTSPHLRRYNERIRINGSEIDDSALCDAFARVDAARGAESLTYFEFGTLAALDIFARAALDVVVLEVGMGGRLDAVNVWNADLAVVTSVDLDHMEWLGPDRETIAFEKAGIFRAGQPAVFGERDVPRRLREHARGIGAPLFCFGAEFGAELQPPNWRWWGPNGRSHALPMPALRGVHQIQNASAALMALEVLAARLPVSPANLRDGLLQARVSGRFEVIPGPVARILDVAHNPHGARALAETLRAHPCSGRTLAVCGMLRDKDMAGSLAALTGQVDAWYVATLDSPRAAPADQLHGVLRELNVAGPVTEFPTLADADRAAMRDARPGDRVLVFGSFFAVAAAL